MQRGFFAIAELLVMFCVLCIVRSRQSRQLIDDFTALVRRLELSLFVCFMLLLKYHFIVGLCFMYGYLMV